MHCTIVLVFGVCATACCLQAFGASQLPPFVVREDRPAPIPPAHLAPIPAYASDGYYRALFRTFLGERTSVLSVIYCPSWGYQGEDAVILFQDSVGDQKPWKLEHAQAKERIWNWDVLVEGGDLLRGIEADRRQTEVSGEFGGKISRAWIVAFDALRLPEDPPMVHDATSVLFSCYDRFGQASFPGFVGTPEKLAKLGRKLRALVTSEPSKREELMHECTTLAGEIVENAKKP